MPSIWEKLRADFPASKNCVYLDHAACSPLPRPVFRKIQEYYQEQSESGDAAWPKWIRRREESRLAVARLINADPSEIAFVPSTSHGMNLIAEMLSGEGTVLTNTSEFPASTLPWIWRKSKIIWQKPEKGRIDLATLKSHLAPSVKTIVTSFVQYATGFRQNLDMIGRMKANRYFVVNATQGLGVFPVDVEKSKIDFLCSNSHKWLMGAYGAGLLYIRKKWLARFKPASTGWWSVSRPERMDNRKVDLKKDASRYELGCPGFPAIFAVGAAVDYLAQIGQEKIKNRILDLTDFAIQGLQKKGFEIISPLEKECRSGNVAFKIKDPKKVWKRLLEKKIYVSPRGAGIRISPHFYNTYEEIETFLKHVTP